MWDVCVCVCSFLPHLAPPSQSHATRNVPEKRRDLYFGPGSAAAAAAAAACVFVFGSGHKIWMRRREKLKRYKYFFLEE